MKFIDLTGKKFGNVLVLKHIGKNRGGQSKWLCKCECGKEYEALGTNLSRPHTVSCGCLNSEIQKNLHIRHNMTGSSIYNAWMGIKDRCYNSNNQAYKWYGGRGIRVSDSWLENFSNFYLDMHYSHKSGLTLDRIDVNGNYENGNCRWATMKEQCRNKRNNRFVEINGVKRCVSEWIELYNTKYSVVNNRLRRGWDIVDAIVKPKYSTGQYAKVGDKI